jgi:hypothetical protein
MYFSVMNLIHHLTDRVVDDDSDMWDRVYWVRDICTYLYGAYVDLGMLRRIHHPMENMAIKGPDSPSGRSSPLNTAIMELSSSMVPQKLEKAKLILRKMRSHLMNMKSNVMHFYTPNDLHEYNPQFMTQQHEEIIMTCSVHADATAVGSTFGSPVYDLVTHLTNHHSHDLDYDDVGRLALYLHDLGIYVDRTTQQCEPWMSVISVIAHILYGVRPRSKFHSEYRKYAEKQGSDDWLKSTSMFDETTRMVYRHVYPFNSQTVGSDKIANDIMNFVRSCIAERM